MKVVYFNDNDISQNVYKESFKNYVGLVPAQQSIEFEYELRGHNKLLIKTWKTGLVLFSQIEGEER